MNTCDGLGAMGDVHCAACYVRPCSATQHVRRATQHVRCATGDVRPAARRATCLATAALVLIGGSGSLLACPVCFGAEETSMIDGAKLGILVLLVITLAVQGAFVGFFLYLRKRAKRIAELDLDNEWSELQGASRTS